MRHFEPTRKFARSLDSADPMRHFKERFYVKEGLIYMDGNSLGLCSKDAEQYVLEALETWKNEGIGLWSAPCADGTAYFDYQDTLGAGLAKLIGADPDEVTVSTHTTIDLHQAVATLHHPTPELHKIIVTPLKVPTHPLAPPPHSPRHHH